MTTPFKSGQIQGYFGILFFKRPFFTNLLQDSQINTVIKSKHKMLFSNVDALYMDCGFSNHVGDGVNWCSPYKSWQTVYDNDLHQILESHGGTIEDRKRITGAEVALWTETVSVSKSTFQKYILFEFKKSKLQSL